MTQVTYRLKGSRRKVSLTELRDFTRHMAHLDGDVKVELFHGEIAATVDAEANSKSVKGGDLPTGLGYITNSGGHLHWSAGVDNELVKISEWEKELIEKRDLPPRDSLGRFTKRK